VWWLLLSFTAYTFRLRCSGGLTQAALLTQLQLNINKKVRGRPSNLSSYFSISISFFSAASSLVPVCWLQVAALKQQQPAAAVQLPGALPLSACSAGPSHAAAAEAVVAATVSSIDGAISCSSIFCAWTVISRACEQ
jgi:hypothetical protein